MKESYREDIASHSGLGPYADDGNVVGVASARGNAGQLLKNKTPNFLPSSGTAHKAAAYAWEIWGIRPIVGVCFLLLSLLLRVVRGFA